MAAQAGSPRCVCGARNQITHADTTPAPALGLLCIVGGLSSVIAFLIGFVAPSQRGHTSPLVYAVLIAAGILALGGLPPLLMHHFRKPAWKTTTVENAIRPEVSSGA